MLSTTLLGRIAQLEAVTALLLALSGPAAQHVTGQALYANGGR